MDGRVEMGEEMVEARIAILWEWDNSGPRRREGSVYRTFEESGLHAMFTRRRFDLLSSESQRLT